MEVKWTKNARNDLKDYYNNSKVLSDKKLDKYIDELINYVDFLNNNPILGKFLFVVNGIEIRQVLYKMHRIIYSINQNEINVLILYHTSRDQNKILQFVKEKLHDNQFNS